jgi:hypothetical protein
MTPGGPVRAGGAATSAAGSSWQAAARSANAAAIVAWMGREQREGTGQG